MELRRYFTILRRRAVIVALSVLAGIGAAYASADRTPRFTANATIYVGTRQLISSNGVGSLSNDTLAGLERISNTFAKMIDTYPIAVDAVERTKVPRSPGSVVAEASANVQPLTQLVIVGVVDRDPAIAQQLANGLVDAFVEKISSFEPGAAPQPGEPPSLPAYVYERARLPGAPAPIGLTRRLVLGGLLGLLAAASLAFLLEYLDLTIKSASDAERRLELPVLAVIPYEPQDALPGIPRGYAGVS
jgi:polysaccharide biosynthesis transport protein